MDRTTTWNCEPFTDPARRPFARQPHPAARHSSVVLRTNGTSRVRWRVRAEPQLLVRERQSQEGGVAFDAGPRIDRDPKEAQ
jgi:hypothetical protein